MAQTIAISIPASTLQQKASPANTVTVISGTDGRLGDGATIGNAAVTTSANAVKIDLNNLTGKAKGPFWLEITGESGTDAGPTAPGSSKTATVYASVTNDDVAASAAPARLISNLATSKAITFLNATSGYSTVRSEYFFGDARYLYLWTINDALATSAECSLKVKLHRL